MVRKTRLSSREREIMTGLESTACSRRGGWPAEAIRAAPLDYLAAERGGLRALASLLERIADTLPRPSRPSALLVAAARLRRCALKLLPLEDKSLIAPIEAAADQNAPARRIAEMVRRKGAMLSGHALELADILETMAERGSVPEAEALGYMLRECFEELRRRAELMEAAILPEVEERFDAETLRVLGESLAAAADCERLSERSGLVVIDGSRKTRRALVGFAR
jgi:hypothetical protein